MVTKKDEKLARYFADTFKEVIQPSLDKLQNTVDVMQVDLKDVKEDVHRIDRKLEK